MKVDLKNKFEKYLPSFFSLIEGDFGWNTINKSFERNFEKSKKSYDNEEKPSPKRNIYSTIIGAIKGDKQDLAYRFYLDNLFKNLSLRLDQNEKKWINKNLKDLLLWEGFLETLGELSVLNNLTDTKVYRLIETEAVNGKRSKGSEKKPGIDFKLKNIETGNDVFIEVVNIELKDENSLNNETINKFLTDKLQGKVNAKNQSGLDYLLIPVLYYEKIDLLKRVTKFYEENNFKIEHSEVPRTFVLASDESFQHFETRFGSIHTVILPKILEG
jgi:hypothetical protein